MKINNKRTKEKSSEPEKLKNQYRDKRIVTAIQYSGNNFEDIADFCGKENCRLRFNDASDMVLNKTAYNSGPYIVKRGDFVLKNEIGGFYSIKEKDFINRYEAV